MVEKTYYVPDVSCEHCVKAITGELSKIDGVAAVEVDIPTKIVTVRSDERVPESAILAGLDEAGYEVAEQRG